jgi:hypothetical protein
MRPMNQDTLDFLTAVLDNPSSSVHKVIKSLAPSAANDAELSSKLRIAAHETIRDCTADGGTFPSYLRTVMTRSVDSVDFHAIVEHLRAQGSEPTAGSSN